MAAQKPDAFFTSLVSNILDEIGDAFNKFFTGLIEDITQEPWQITFLFGMFGQGIQKWESYFLNRYDILRNDLLFAVSNAIQKTIIFAIPANKELNTRVITCEQAFHLIIQSWIYYTRNNKLFDPQGLAALALRILHRWKLPIKIIKFFQTGHWFVLWKTIATAVAGTIGLIMMAGACLSLVFTLSGLVEAMLRQGVRFFDPLSNRSKQVTIPSGFTLERRYVTRNPQDFFGTP